MLCVLFPVDVLIPQALEWIEMSGSSQQGGLGEIPLLLLFINLNEWSMTNLNFIYPCLIKKSFLRKI